MDATYGLIYSQRVLLKLIDHGMTREEAYDLVQPNSLRMGSSNGVPSVARCG